MDNKESNWNLIIKALLLGLLLFMIYKHISVKGIGFDQSVQVLIDRTKNINIRIVLFVVFLMPINWLIEALRFRFLMSKFVKLGYGQSLVSVLCGVAVASITPNRIGEYGGRIIALDVKNNKYGLLATFAGSVAQNLTNLVFGMFGSVYFLGHYLNFSDNQLYSTVFVVALVSMMICYFYFHLDLLANIFNKLSFIPFSKKIYRALQETQKMGAKLLTIVLFLSALRYIVYISQYVLILYAFHLNIPLIAAISGVALIYLIQSGLPIPPLFGLIARGEIALLVWGVFVQDELVILTATLLLWIINLILPSFIGLIFVNKINILKSLGYVKNTDSDYMHH